MGPSIGEFARLRRLSRGHGKVARFLPPAAGFSHYTFTMKLPMRPDRLALAVTFFMLALAIAAASTPAQEGSWQQDLVAWRAQHAADLQKSDGWLSLTGLEWLVPGDNTLGSAAENKIHLPASAPPRVGILHLQGTTVTLLPPPGGFAQDLLIDGKAAQSQELRTGADTDKGNPRITIGTLNFYAVRRADRFALRIKDAKSPAMVGFHGLKWYAPDAAFRVQARWTPYIPPKTLTLATLIGTSYDQPVPGAAEFTLEGKTYQLEPIVEENPASKLFFILRDTTNTSTTYEACRFLYTGLPSNGLNKAGALVLDFNHLENPPCAYPPYATCPLPPPGNRLPMPFPVGEQRYHE
jgi:uncharacterized protein